MSITLSLQLLQATSRLLSFFGQQRCIVVVGFANDVAKETCVRLRCAFIPSLIDQLCAMTDA